MAHREDIRAYLEGLTIGGLAVDWGAGSKPVKRYAKGDAKWVTVDKNPDTRPDHLTDIQQQYLEFIGLADHAFCMEVLEHTTDPLAVLENIYRNLKHGGKLHISVPFLFPEHGDEDYWRFTSKGLRYLVEKAGFKKINLWEITDGFILEAVK